jgi:hypothetical protein
LDTKFENVQWGLYILILDVQFSNEMSNACPIGHFREKA